MSEVMTKVEKKRPIKSYNTCKHVHIDQRTRTAGTPYIKGWCNTCGAWVYTEKSFCICCMKRVKHRTHHLHTKQVMNKAVEIYSDNMDDFRGIDPKMSDMLYVSLDFKDRRYHIPIKYIILWNENIRQNELLPEILDVITTVRR